jgi:hypothetical protein
MHQRGRDGGIGTRVEGRYFKRHSDVKEEGESRKGDYMMIAGTV